MNELADEYNYKFKRHLGHSFHEIFIVRGESMDRCIEQIVLEKTK